MSFFFLVCKKKRESGSGERVRGGQQRGTDQPPLTERAKERERDRKKPENIQKKSKKKNDARHREPPRRKRHQPRRHQPASSGKGHPEIQVDVSRLAVHLPVALLPLEHRVGVRPGLGITSPRGRRRRRRASLSGGVCVDQGPRELRVGQLVPAHAASRGGEAGEEADDREPALGGSGEAGEEADDREPALGGPGEAPTTGSAHDDGGPAREDNARRRRSSSGARGSRPREVLEFERRGKRVVSDEKEEEQKKRRRKGALSLQALSLSRRKGSIFDLRCPFRALSAELRMPQWMQHIRKRAS